MLRTPCPIVPVAVVATALVTGVCADVRTASARADDCLSVPNASSPHRGHLFYRIHRGKRRKCWYLGTLRRLHHAARHLRDDARSAKSANTPLLLGQGMPAGSVSANPPGNSLTLPHVKLVSVKKTEPFVGATSDEPRRPLLPSLPFRQASAQKSDNNAAVEDAYTLIRLVEMLFRLVSCLGISFVIAVVVLKLAAARQHKPFRQLLIRRVIAEKPSRHSRHPVAPAA